MQITLNSDEILDAVETYVRGQINIADNQEISIDFTAGRGEKGLTATVDLRAPKAAAPKPAAKPTPVAETPEEKPAEEKADDGPQENVFARKSQKAEPEAAGAKDEETVSNPKSLFSQAKAG